MTEQQLREEWEELNEDYKKLETINKTYLGKLEEVIQYQKECEKQIQHQRYRINIISANLKTAKAVNLKDEILKREAELDVIQQTLPRQSGPYLRVILGGVNVSILNKEDKLKYKSEYEKFKLILSAVAFVMSITNLLVLSRLLEKLYLFLLVWYYCTLTIREGILQVNGSRIKGWWTLHHFISTVAAAILLIWPESDIWNEFKTQFMIFNAYLSIVQFLQFRYQQGVLYRLKALGERHNMDITIEGFHSWMWRGLSFLFPFLFIVYFYQLYIAYTLFYLRIQPGATWHVTALCILFLVLSAGNITTMLLIIPDKLKNRVRLQYKILSERLTYRWLSTNGKEKKK